MLVTLAAQVAGAISHANATSQILVEPTSQTTIPVDFSVPGISGAPGVAIGTAAVVFQESRLDSVPDRTVTHIEDEIQSFRKAVQKVQDELEQIKVKLGERLPAEERLIFDAYIMMLDSDTLVDGTMKIFGDELVSGLGQSPFIVSDVEVGEGVEFDQVGLEMYGTTVEGNLELNEAEAKMGVEPSPFKLADSIIGGNVKAFGNELVSGMGESPFIVEDTDIGGNFEADQLGVHMDGCTVDGNVKVTKAEQVMGVEPSPFKIEDEISVMDGANTVAGKVVDMTLFFVFVEDAEGNRVTVPNNIVLQRAVVTRAKKPEV